MRVGATCRTMRRRLTGPIQRTSMQEKWTALAAAINKPRETVYAFLRLAPLDKRIVDAYESVLEIKR